MGHAQQPELIPVKVARVYLRVSSLRIPVIVTSPSPSSGGHDAGIPKNCLNPPIASTREQGFGHVRNTSSAGLTVPVPYGRDARSVARQHARSRGFRSVGLVDLLDL